jgi:peptide/nickel transport system substrate-binding protein
MKAPIHRSVRRAALACAFAPLLAWSAPQQSNAESVVTVAMTAGDIPNTTGNPDQGFEGFRFVGYNIVTAQVARG